MEELILLMSILPKEIYRINDVPIKILMHFFVEVDFKMLNTCNTTNEPE